MMRLWFALVFLVLGLPALAQDSQVIVKSELSGESTVVGQPLILRITVLVPTWLPEPPRFPSLDAPNMIVRLPSRASSPVSERVDGETWSGVSRAYRLYPMIAGDFSLTPQPVAITYADPDTRDPISVEVELQPVAFRSEVPAGAEDLDPLILAEAFSLNQTLEGADGPLAQGEAATRVVTAKITGTSALFIPPLTPPVSEGSVRAYSKDPEVRDTEANRGTLSGSRSETTSYVAQYGGTLELPPISIDWFNTKSSKVETASLEGVTLEVDAPPPPKEPVLDRTQAVKLAGVLVLLGLLVWILKRYAIPPIAKRLRQNRENWMHSEPYAAKQVRRAIGAHDLSLVYGALATWSARCPGTSGEALEAALAQVGQLRYQPARAGKGSWAVLSAAFQEDRDRRLKRRAASDLPPLNPL